MTEREAVVIYLRAMAKSEPPEGYPVDKEKLRMGRAMLLASADQIEQGVHVMWAATEVALKELEEDE